MFNLVSLVVAAALVSLQCSYEANAAIEHPKIISNLVSNELPAPRRRVLSNYIKFKKPLPQSVDHIPGTPLVLMCEAYGKPAPTISWLKNGIPISDLEEDSNEVFTVHPESIAAMISKLVVPSPSNGDVITCVATAGPNEKVSSTTIYSGKVPQDVLADLFSLPSGPIITAFYKDIFQVQGSSITLPCRIFSATESELMWLDNKDNPVFESPRIKVLPSGDLHITGLSWEDMGGFTCSVKNMYGENSMTTFLYPYAP